MSRLRSPFSIINASTLRSFHPSSLLSKIRQPSSHVIPSTNFIRCYARKKEAGPPRDIRIRLMHKTMYHPLTPRTLKFGRFRELRHWTIYRAWQLYKHKLKRERYYELQRQWQKMQLACEALKGIDERLFRIATSRKEVGEFPLELRLPTDTPPRNGWNEGWKRD